MTPVHRRDLSTEFPGPQRMIDVLDRAVDMFGDDEMIVTPTVRLTYRQADRASRALAERLVDAGAGKGARTAAHLPNGAEWLVAFLAATRIGALFMPFSAAYKPAELRRGLQLGDVQYLIASTESWHGGSYTDFLGTALPELRTDSDAPLRCAAVPHLRQVWLFGDGPAPACARKLSLDDDAADASVTDDLLAAIEDQVVPADDALIIWTSGTTADPKGAVHTQGTLGRRAKANAYSHAYVRDDRIFCDFAFWWVGGPGYGFLPAFWVGATIVAIPKHDGDDTEAFLRHERPTRIAGWPRERTARVLVSGEGSSHMTAPRGIGMTETFGPHSMMEPRSIEEICTNPLPGLGPAILGFERRLVDPETGDEVPEGAEGELLVRGPGMMRGLYRREHHEVFDNDGWYHTGDKCLIVDGSIEFVSRTTEMIKTSGSNVAPFEVELVLLSIEGIAEAAVFGLPDEARGEQVVAVVVPAEDAEIDVGLVRDRVRDSLSNYKVPRHVVVVADADVPRLHSGKPDKRALSHLAVGRLASEMSSATR